MSEYGCLTTMKMLRYLTKQVKNFDLMVGEKSKNSEVGGNNSLGTTNASANWQDNPSDSCKDIIG